MATSPFRVHSINKNTKLLVGNFEPQHERIQGFLKNVLGQGINVFSAHLLIKSPGLKMSQPFVCGHLRCTKVLSKT